MDIRIEQLKQKKSLSIDDACFLLQFIQGETAPLLSLRGSGSTPPPLKGSSHNESLKGKGLQGGGRYKKIVGQGRRNLKARLDVSNMDDFPPVSASIQGSSNRGTKQTERPRRRITPTPLNSQPNSSVWKGSSCHQAFIGSSTLPDTRQALMDNRSQIQEEIMSKRQRQSVKEESVSPNTSRFGSISETAIQRTFSHRLSHSKAELSSPESTGAGVISKAEAISPILLSANPRVSELSPGVYNEGARSKGSPGASSLGFTSPGTSSLGVASPGASSLGVTSPGASSLGVASPGASSLGVLSPGASSLGVASPGASSLGVLSPGASSLGVTSPGASSLGVASPGASSLGVLSPGASSLGVASPGASSLGVLSPGASSLGVASPGASSLGVTSPGASSLGVLSPGASSLGVASPGASSLGVTSPGVTSPETSSMEAHTCSSTESKSEADQSLLNDLAILYSNAIKELLVPNVVSEMQFVLQLLTLDINPHLSANASSKVFKEVDDCVFFSLSVIDNIKQNFLMLDRSTIELLADNNRITRFKPGLKTFFSAHLEKDNHYQELNVVFSEHVHGEGGVQFQEDTDNSKNFPDIKAFHAFKKQRDVFYSVLREWKKHHDDPKWTMSEHLSDKIIIITKRYGESCSCAYFAKLFLKQLMNSCCASLTDSIGSDLFGSSLGQQLNKMDPKRLMKLTKRFYEPSSSNISASPSFIHIEEFFSDFITIADSYIFNQHLILAFTEEILQIHSTMSATNGSDLKKYFNFVKTLRILAKFLGFLDFLPFSKPHGMVFKNRVVSIDLVQCLKDACTKGHLCITVPWVTQYMSMMDNQAITLEHYHSVLLLLMDIYRSYAASMESSSVWFLLVCTLGWLFEIPNFPAGFFSEHQAVTNCVCSFGNIPSSWDNQIHITSDVLYFCCPSLNDMHSLLAEYAAGLQRKSTHRRKIKPLSTTREVMKANPLKEIGHQLVDNFFRGHPQYMRKICELTSERLSSSAIAHINTDIIPKYIEMASLRCVKWLKSKEFNSIKVELFPRLESEEFIFSDIGDNLYKDISNYTTDYCRAEGMAALHSLLGGILTTQVVSVACTITTNWSVAKCMEWARLNAKDKIEEEVIKAFDRGKRGILSQRKSTASCTDGVMCSDEISSNLILTTLSSFKNVYEEQIHSTSSIIDKKEKLLFAIISVERLIRNCAYVCPGVPFLPQMIPSHFQDFISLSMDLAVHLVSCGGFVSCKLHINLSSFGCDILDNLIECWKLCKGLKIDVNANRLLSASAFEKYCSVVSDCEDTSVWISLSYVLIGILCNEIVPSYQIEGLWLCRWHHFRNAEVKQFQLFVDGISVFLQKWHSISGYKVRDQEPIFVSVHFVRLLTVAMNVESPVSCSLPESINNSVTSYHHSNIISLISSSN